MLLESYDLNLKVVITLTIGFALASILGYLSQKLKLSPILGYLLAGYAIGPYFPGFVADSQLAEQLAEVGVMLMMFGVGLHFKWQDLAKVKNIAIPGAIGQTFVAATVATFAVRYIGGSWDVGLMMGLSIGVASTVVLVRVLTDQNLLKTLQGHIAVGWLIVEDILTVAVLIFLPTIVVLLKGGSISLLEILLSMVFLLFKFILLAAIMFTLGRKIVSYALLKTAQTRSQELFTLAILALIFVIAASSALIFGTSIALGAFIAGMVIGQTDVRHQASAYASPMKDAFVVIFFLSVGMLFNPIAIIEHFSLFIIILLIILVVKPLAAFVITVLLRYPAAVALTVAIALAQIGEFSFILAEEAAKYQIFPDEAYDVIVACALISISINPLLFKLCHYFKPALYETESSGIHTIKEGIHPSPTALVIGCGVIGQEVIHTLEKAGVRPLIIDRNVDKVMRLIEKKHEVVYGEASFPNMLKMAKIESANLLIITIPDLTTIINIIKYAQELHPTIVIIARARHVEELPILLEAGANYVCCDDTEVSQAFDRVLKEILENEEPLYMNSLESIS